MKRKILILISAIIFVTNTGNTQTDLYDYVDTTAIAQGKLQAIETLNTPQFEFSPTWFNNGILYVYSNTEKKRIRLKEELNFNLSFSAWEKGAFGKKSDFQFLEITGSIEGPSAYADKEKKLFITRNLVKGEDSRIDDELKLGIYIYKNEEGSWILNEEIPVNSSYYNTCHPSWDENEKRLIFASDMPGGYGKLDLYEVFLQVDGNWSSPSNLGPAINSSENDCFPYLHDNNYLFYSSNREGGQGGLDVYFSRQLNGKWFPGSLMPSPINSMKDDLGLILDSTARTLIFSSSRAGGMGKDDLYMIEVEKAFLIPDPPIHSIQIISSESKLPVPDCQVSIHSIEKSRPIIVEHDEEFKLQYDLKEKKELPLAHFQSDDDGMVKFNLPVQDYLLILEKDHFETKKAVIHISEKPFNESIVLDSTICRPLDFIFYDAENGREIEDVVVEFDVEGGIHVYEKDGRNLPCIMPGKNLAGFILSPSYKIDSFDIHYDALIDEEKVAFHLHAIEKYVENLPLEKGDKFVLKNILYAFDSFALNEAAKKELDELALHLNEYPGLSIELSSHTDSRGMEKYNQILSDKRAESAKSYLVDKGIDSSRIAAVGYGESRLLNDCSNGTPCDESQHSVNRRTEVKVIESQ